MASAPGFARIRVNGKEFDPSVSSTLTIGRDPSCDVILEDDRVSRRHAVIQAEPRGWVFRDSDSRNGSFLDGRPVDEIPISGPSRLLLGDADDGAVLEVAPTRVERTVEPQQAPAVARRSGPPVVSMKLPEPSLLGKLSQVHHVLRPQVRIGRDPENDLVLTDLRVSRRHADLTRHSDGTFELVDAGSANGTFVNGHRITRAGLSEGDVVAIGNHVLRFAQGTLEEYEERGEAWLVSAGLSVAVDGRLILDNVSFPLEPRSLLAVVGPSGVGKTTLLNALTGFRPADRGTVTYGGRDLYASYDELRQRMGYVPQEDILHPQLTVGKALDYSAQLRFPPDVDRPARHLRVREVMAELGIGERADLRIDRLSGGQRKRVSVALELLTKPSLLFLDEPTSGLDPGNESQVMQLLRELADGGRIVIVVTHSTQSLHLCDRVLFLAPGGRTAYYGPPKEALGYFEQAGAGDEYDEIFRTLDESRTTDWARRFATDGVARSYVSQPLARVQASVDTGRIPQVSPPPRPQPWFRQFQVLLRRYVAVLRSDSRNVALLALQAPIFGLLFMLLVSPNRLSTTHGPEATLLIWLLVMGATWLGTSNAIREIVKELPVYRRERAVGLSISAYVASKVGVLGIVTILQCAVMVPLALLRQPLPPIDPIGLSGRVSNGLFVPPLPSDGAVLGSPMAELILDVVLAGLAAMALGLLLSAIARTSDRALILLPLILVGQLVLSVPFLPTDSPILRPVGTISSAQWGMAAGGSTVSLNQLRAFYFASLEVGRAGILEERPNQDLLRQAFEGEERWDHEEDVWILNVMALLAMTVVFIAAGGIVLRARDPKILSGGAVRAGPAPG